MRTTFDRPVAESGECPPLLQGTCSHSVKSWVLDELAHAGRENLDAQHVARYDGIEDADAEVEVQLLCGLGMDRSSIVVDLGAGTGQFAIAAAPHVRQVIAVDISPVMLSALRAEHREVSGTTMCSACWVAF